MRGSGMLCSCLAHLPFSGRCVFMQEQIRMKHGGNVWDGGRPDAWTDFSANLRPEGMPEWVKQVLAESLDSVRYYPDRTMELATRGIAQYAGLPEECILPTAGGAAAIDLVIGDGVGRVVVKQPTFGEYTERAAANGRTVVADNSHYLAGDTVIRCNPNNPTGEALTKAEILRLFEEARRADAELMVDEAFADFFPRISVKKEVRSGLTVVGSLTKILGIPGVRLGYVCASPEKILRLRQKVLPWGISTFASSVAAELPKHLEEIAQDQKINEIRREAMKRELESIGIEVYPSSANFLLCRFPFDTSCLVELLRKRCMLVRTCESFGLDAGYLRIAVKTQEQNGELIRIMKHWLEKGKDELI